MSQLCLYRLDCVRKTALGHVMFARTVQAMRTERDKGLRRSKAIMSRTLLSSLCMGSVTYAIMGSLYHTFLLYPNIQASTTQFQVICWVFWWLQDMMSVAAVTMTMVVFPTSWMLMALEYRLDLMRMTLSLSLSNQTLIR